MPCGGGVPLTDLWASMQLMDAVTCAFARTTGGTAFALMVLASIALALTVYTESVQVPVVFVLLLGGIFVLQLPAGIVQLVAVAILFVLAIGGTVLTLKLDRAGI